MQKTSLLLGLGLLLTSFAAQALINNQSKLFEAGVSKVLAEIEASVETIENPEICSTKFNNIYGVLYNFNSKDVNLPQMSDSDLSSLTQESFELRLKLKEKLKDLKFEETYGPSCLKGVKEVVKALRYVEDYFIEYLYKRTGRDNEEFVTFEGSGIHFLKAPGVVFDDHTQLEAGDVLISRGNAYTSAAIARIGQDDYQFSHMTLVNRNEAGELYTSEAHIEWGNVVEPFQVHIDQKNARTVLFRQADKELANLASQTTYNLIKNHKAQKGFNIEYDFAMDLSNADRIFCSEVPYYGYLQASKELYGKEMKLPLYPMKFEEAHLEFLQKIGIMVDEDNIKTFTTFGPGDMQFDPRFEMLAEWRNPKKMQDTRFKDAILTKLFEWMADDQYRFRTSLGQKIQNSFAWLMRRNRFMTKKLELDLKFPLNMKIRQMNIFTVLDVVGDILYAELEAAQAKSETPLTFKELYETLEDYRKKDLAIYKSKKRKAKLHKRFRP